MTDMINPAESPVIVAENVSKRYIQNEQRPSLRHEAGQMLRRLIGRSTETSAASNIDQQFWALQGVNLSIYAGESVAVIGRNGAGKSTLFRILSGITTPTTGHVAVCGRFATLIALGAGFNPERTGRENIYLNAAIQGFSPRQIAPFLDEIIAFSELGRFIDLPVKRYSSGMTARLGFSVAVHILPDIMFIDEVLSVGDAAFQEKCMKRIAAMKAQGRTLVFVSHSADTVRNLCERAIWLHKGRLMLDGPVDMVLEHYRALLSESSTESAQIEKVPG